MLFPDKLDYTIAEPNIPLPRMFKARQKFARKKLEDIEGAVRAEIQKLQLPDLKGKTIALTGGSRGVDNQARILKAVADNLKQLGARPFIVPGMGSHAGATAEGQTAFLAGYNITEEYCGVPIKATMEVARVGTTASGFPVYCDKNAWEADYIMPVHRVKLHTDFKGPYESGLCKMMVIGLGKHKGATHIHSLGFEVFHTLIPEAAKVHFDAGHVLAGIAIVENAFDETMIIEGIPTHKILEREPELLNEYKRNMAKFYMDRIDLLIVEEIGKDVSGAGMDCNVTGRPTSELPGFESIPIKRIAVLGISEKSHGNGIGVGFADIVTVPFMKQLDIAPMYTNSITARMLGGSRIPFVTNHDLDAVRIGIFSSLLPDLTKVKVVQIINTMYLSEILMSENYLPEIKNDPRFEILSEPEPMQFDANGKLARLPRPSYHNL